MNKPTFEEAVAAVLSHIRERHWDTGTPRSLAISISLEASELMEHYQWQDEPVGDDVELADELADILIYAIQFADKYKIDIPEAITGKLEKAARKYPAEKFDTTDEVARRETWIEAKKNHRKDTIL